jgi:predicted nucleic acid-binding protein
VRSKDALIAAQAHRHGGTLMTANTDYFARFSRLIAVVEPVLR